MISILYFILVQLLLHYQSLSFLIISAEVPIELELGDTTSVLM
jgi:hypothetical protein